ncbi:MAG: crotonase/enoyl-CoA hydratase family protein [Alphaproteobacteria bacterium]|nr:crotonase/enoyl-CoA hydratase family protein [Alphaproteobacteria bacterium]
MSANAGADEGRIKTREEGALLLIKIDRPKKLNGFSPKMLEELAEAFGVLETSGNVRCGLLYAEGEHFTAGLELDKVARHLAEKGELWPPGSIDPFSLRPPMRSKPLVAAVKGICFTIGIELMLAADLVVAAEDCRFAQLEVRRGIMPTGGATIRMVERAGWGNAMRWLLTGEEFDAATALRLGFVQEVVPKGLEMQRARELAHTIAQQAPLAVAATLRNARLALMRGQEAGVAEFNALQQRLLRSDDAAEGVRSFIERRGANFTGN